VIVPTNGRQEIAQDFASPGGRRLKVAILTTETIIYLAAMVITFALLYIAAGLIFIGMRVLVHLARGFVRAVVSMSRVRPSQREAKPNRSS
jgi:hypothetical protein